MSEQSTSRRQFLRQSAIATSAATFIGSSLSQQAAVMAAKLIDPSRSRRRPRFGRSMSCSTRRTTPPSRMSCDSMVTSC